MLLAGCGARQPAERCRNLLANPNWSLPHFARLESGSFLVDSAADGAIAHLFPKPEGLGGLGVIAVGYARVEMPEAPAGADQDITPQLWSGTVALVAGYQRWRGGFESPYTRLQFTGREVASGAWKRFVTGVAPVRWARSLYPHFAFWGMRPQHGVKLRLAGLALVVAPVSEDTEPEPWTACPSLPAPSPVLESATARQWTEDLEPDGAFDDSFALRGGTLSARYRQASAPADRFLVSITEDGSDPRLSPTSRVLTVLARRDSPLWEVALPLKPGGRPRIAVAAAALTAAGLQVQPPVLPFER